MRRQIAARLLQQGKGVREVARLLGVSPSSVSRKPFVPSPIPVALPA
ncbi:MAG: helix-turn-helix domain-containing protein [Armatimonadota bacterium]